jgi:hypothetical protein
MSERTEQLKQSLPGAFVPQCDDNGGFKDLQFHSSTGEHFCVYENGTEIGNTRSQSNITPNCTNGSRMHLME